MSNRHWNSERQEWVYPRLIEKDQLKSLLEEAWWDGYHECAPVDEADEALETYLLK